MQEFCVFNFRYSKRGGGGVSKNCNFYPIELKNIKSQQAEKRLMQLMLEWNGRNGKIQSILFNSTIEKY